MTQPDNTDPALIARYETAGAIAAFCGYTLAVMRLATPLFVLSEGGATVRTFTDIAHIEAFLRGTLKERDRRRRKNPGDEQES